MATQCILNKSPHVNLKAKSLRCHSFFTCHDIGFGEYGAVAAPVPCQYSHSVVLPTLQLGQLTGHAAGITGVNVSTGLSEDCVIICSSAGPPSHRHYTRRAVQSSAHICRVTGCWRREGKMGITTRFML